mmetsp:Transcript_30800/g.84942  ORF Transcript_30800/g.84942 Transcript_30800/m.84942 type:complete len:250 (+) Transcript_30800:624-1373(+)
MRPSPEGLSSKRKAVRSGSGSVQAPWLERSATAAHSTQSTVPLQSRSRARARRSRCSSGTSAGETSINALRPCTNSLKSSRPSSLVSRAKNTLYQGMGCWSGSSSASEAICAQTTSTSCCRASRRAKRVRSWSRAVACAAPRTAIGSFAPLARGVEGADRPCSATCNTGWSVPPESPGSTHGCRRASVLVKRTLSSTKRNRCTRSWACRERPSHAARLWSYSPAWIRRTVRSRGSSPWIRKGLAPTRIT